MLHNRYKPTTPQLLVLLGLCGLTGCLSRSVHSQPECAPPVASRGTTSMAISRVDLQENSLSRKSRSNRATAPDTSQIPERASHTRLSSVASQANPPAVPQAPLQAAELIAEADASTQAETVPTAIAKVSEEKAETDSRREHIHVSHETHTPDRPIVKQSRTSETPPAPADQLSNSHTSDAMDEGHNSGISKISTLGTAARQVLSAPKAPLVDASAPKSTKDQQIQTVGNTRPAVPQILPPLLDTDASLPESTTADFSQESTPVESADEESISLASSDSLPDWEEELLQADVYPINLPTALAMIGGQHPVVGFAQWQVQEAYARLDQAEILWLPSIQPGFSFRKRDGNYQDVFGEIVDVHLNSFQYGLGSGAVGAGTVPRPGIVAQFHLADAIFQPQVAQKMAWARGHRANAVLNQQLLEAAQDYLELLAATQEQIILEQTRQLTDDLSQLTSGFARTGEGLQADADRLQTELILAENRLIAAEERIGVASARLAQTLSLRHHGPLKAMDVTVLPLEMVSREMDRHCLVGMALSQRPELQESQALVVAAMEEYKRQKYAPFIPSVLLGYSAGGFGGGNANSLANLDARHDFDAIVSWEVRQFGFGEKAARREASSRIEQAKFEKVRIMDQVTREVAEAHEQVRHRRRQIEKTEAAIQSAQDSYDRNLARIREAQGLPLEVLQSLRALEDARRAYLKAVVDFNQAQFQLQWALGWQIEAH